MFMDSMRRQTCQCKQYRLKIDTSWPLKHSGKHYLEKKYKNGYQFCWQAIKGIVQAKMVKIIKFLFFAQKVFSGMGALRPKFLGG